MVNYKPDFHVCQHLRYAEGLQMPGGKKTINFDSPGSFHIGKSIVCRVAGEGPVGLSNRIKHVLIPYFKTYGLHCISI